MCIIAELLCIMHVIGYVSLFHDLHFISLSIIILLLFTPEMIVIILFRVELLFIESTFITKHVQFGSLYYLAIHKISCNIAKRSAQTMRTVFLKKKIYINRS